MIYEKWILKWSDNNPWTGGMNAPPKIIMIKNEEACPVNFPIPAIANEKIQGHMMEQKSPPLKNANTDTVPFVIKPISIANAPSDPKIKSVNAGFCLPNKNAAINNPTQIE